MKTRHYRLERCRRVRRYVYIPQVRFMFVWWNLTLPCASMDIAMSVIKSHAASHGVDEVCITDKGWLI